MRLAALVLLLPFSLCAQAPAGCSLQKDKEGIRVYTCHQEGSQFKSIITYFDIATTFTELRRVALDIGRYPEWQYNTSAAEAIRLVSPDEIVYYSHIDAPWPVSDRDLVMRLTIAERQDTLTIVANSEPDLLPVKPDCIRVPSSQSSWMVTKNRDHLSVVYKLKIDPGGSIPAWLVNMACAQGPYESFSNLKRLLEKK